MIFELVVQIMLQVAYANYDKSSERKLFNKWCMNS